MHLPLLIVSTVGKLFYAKLDCVVAILDPDAGILFLVWARHWSNNM
jgi:hypothetical protein